MVRHFHAGHGPGRYVLVGGGEREYLACDRCGAIEEVDRSELDSLREEVQERFGFAVGFAHFPMVGLCPRCAARRWRCGLVSFEFLFQPVEQIDAWLEGLFAGAPLVVALLIALALGLRHASDPDHLVAVTSLVAVDGGDVRGAARLGAWWGAGHAHALLVIGDPADPLQVLDAGLARAGR